MDVTKPYEFIGFGAPPAPSKARLVLDVSVGGRHMGGAAYGGGEAVLAVRSGQPPASRSALFRGRPSLAEGGPSSMAGVGVSL